MDLEYLEERHGLAMERIREIMTEGLTKDVAVADAWEGFDEYFRRMAGFLVLLDDVRSSTSAQLVQYYPGIDIALIRLNTKTSSRRPAVLMDRAGSLALNEELTTMGFPAASEANFTIDATRNMISGIDNVSVNKGTFSNLNTQTDTQQGDQIVTNAMMSAGISGGPLLDKDGYVVGVCVGGSASNQNVNYAVTTGELLKLLRSVNGVKYEVGPIASGLSTTMLIIIIAAAILIIVLVLLIILSATKKSNNRTLVFTSLSGKTISLKKGTPVVIGRDPSRCQVVYPKDTQGVSSVHCTITFDGTQVLVADNGSSYGTYIGGQKVEPGKPMVMHRGQEVTFGSNKNGAELH